MAYQWVLYETFQSYLMFVLGFFMTPTSWRIPRTVWRDLYSMQDFLVQGQISILIILTNFRGQGLKGGLGGLGLSKDQNFRKGEWGLGGFFAVDKGTRIWTYVRGPGRVWLRPCPWDESRPMPHVIIIPRRSMAIQLLIIYICNESIRLCWWISVSKFFLTHVSSPRCNLGRVMRWVTGWC